MGKGKLLLILFLSFSTLPAFAFTGSISGVVLGKNTNLPISNVGIRSYYSGKEIKSDSNGKFSFKNLSAGKYILDFTPPDPYCCNPEEEDCRKIIQLKTNEHIFIKLKLGIGGSIKGKISINSEICHENFEILVNSDDGFIKTTSLNADNTFVFGGLYPAKNYYITLRHGQPGYSFKHIFPIQVEAKKCVELPTIKLQFDDTTGLRGSIRSLINGNPIPGAEVTFYYTEKVMQLGSTLRCGNVKMDKTGHFIMRSLEPGKYLLRIAPPVPPPIDPATGKYIYNPAEHMELVKKMDIIVKRGEMKNLNIQFDIPYFNKQSRKK